MMITYLEGTIKDISEKMITIMVHGVGYGVSVVDCALYSENTQVALYIRQCWHQDEGPQLYGFKTRDERTIFDLIISCSGIGPKIALAALEAMKPAVFVLAIAERDTKALSSISGIGTKKAEVIILQLKGKVEKLIDAGFGAGEAPMLGAFKDLSGVLTSLGYSQKEIAPAVSYARAELPGNANFDECLRKALSYLSKK